MGIEIEKLSLCYLCNFMLNSMETSASIAIIDSSSISSHDV